MTRAGFVGACAILLAALAACRPAENAPAPRTGTHLPVVAPVPQSAASVVLVKRGAVRPDTRAAVAFVDVAATRADRERGLGGRTALDPDHGMLFVYASTALHRFWMKDCAIGLDIAFVREDGTIARIATLPPAAGLPDEEIPDADSGEPVRYVVEMEPHWFARHGVAAGDRIDVAAAAAGVRPE